VLSDQDRDRVPRQPNRHRQRHRQRLRPRTKGVRRYRSKTSAPRALAGMIDRKAD
jgi:hypothetical protein